MTRKWMNVLFWLAIRMMGMVPYETMIGDGSMRIRLWPPEADELNGPEWLLVNPDDYLFLLQELSEEQLADALYSVPNWHLSDTAALGLINELLARWPDVDVVITKRRDDCRAQVERRANMKVEIERGSDETFAKAVTSAIFHWTMKHYQEIKATP